MAVAAPHFFPLGNLFVPFGTLLYLIEIRLKMNLSHQKNRLFVPFGTFHPAILFLTLKLRKSISLVIPISCRCGFAFSATGPNIALVDWGAGDQRDEMRSYSSITLGRKGEHPLVLKDLSRGKSIAGSGPVVVFDVSNETGLRNARNVAASNGE
jgi:hypothetical protein